MEQSEKLKISSDFIFPKLILNYALGVLFLLLTDFKRTETNVLIQNIFYFLVLSFFMYFLFTRPKIYYDNDVLYIKKGKGLITEVPLTNIQSIKFSIIGFGANSRSYIVKYKDKENQLKSIRIFPSFFSSSFSEFIKTVEKTNSNVIITNWSIGFNELFD